MENLKPYRADWSVFRRRGQLEDALAACQQNYLIAIERGDLFWADTFFASIYKILEQKGSQQPLQELKALAEKLLSASSNLSEEDRDALKQNIKDNIALIESSTRKKPDVLKELDTELFAESLDQRLD